MRQAIRICPAGEAMPDADEPVSPAAHDAYAEARTAVPGRGIGFCRVFSSLRSRIPISFSPLPDMPGSCAGHARFLTF
jgi:hypothetical protein